MSYNAITFVFLFYKNFPLILLWRSFSKLSFISFKNIGYLPNLLEHQPLTSSSFDQVNSKQALIQ